jgi:thioredoxin-like negative regulator of GroEL
VPDDWFRSSSWSAEDRELFETKLARAQKRRRAQYVRIQAVSLAESDDATARAAAGDLYERIFSEYPDDELQVTMAHTDKARWHRRRGEHAQAIEHYRQAVELEDALGSIDWGADLDLAELLVERGEGEEALALLARVPETAESRRVAALARLGTNDASGTADLDARLEALLERVKHDEAARREYVDLLEMLGADDPRTPRYRRALASRLY